MKKNTTFIVLGLIAIIIFCTSCSLRTLSRHSKVVEGKFYFPPVSDIEKKDFINSLSDLTFVDPFVLGDVYGEVCSIYIAYKKNGLAELFNIKRKYNLRRYVVLDKEKNAIFSVDLMPNEYTKIKLKGRYCENSIYISYNLRYIKYFFNGQVSLFFHEYSHEESYVLFPGGGGTTDVITSFITVANIGLFNNFSKNGESNSGERIICPSELLLVHKNIFSRSFESCDYTNMTMPDYITWVSQNI